MKYLKYFFIALFLFGGVVTAIGAVSFMVPTQQGNYQIVTLLSATSTIGTATSTNLTGGGGYAIVAGAKHVVFYFSRSATSTNNGSSSFTIQTTKDASAETAWENYNTLEQNVATSTYPAVLSSVSIASGTTTTMVYMKNLGFYAVRCVGVLTTDGANTCKVGIEN